MSAAIEAAARAYARFYETLTPDLVGDLRALVVPEVRFKDPFNDVRGADLVVRVMEQMFEDATEIRFEIGERAVHGDLCFYRWRFWFLPRRFARGAPWQVQGVSTVRFDPAGKVAEHIDYWDAAEQIYERLPVLGMILRRVRGAMAVRG